MAHVQMYRAIINTFGRSFSEAVGTKGEMVSVFLLYPTYTITTQVRLISICSCLPLPAILLTVHEKGPSLQCTNAITCLSRHDGIIGRIFNRYL